MITTKKELCKYICHLFNKIKKQHDNRQLLLTKTIYHAAKICPSAILKFGDFRGLGQISFFIFHPLYRYRFSNVGIYVVEKNHKKAFLCLNRQKAGSLLQKTCLFQHFLFS